MSDREISFSYTLGAARFTGVTSVDSDEWDDMDQEERVEVLEQAAMEDIENDLEIEMESIED